jgi:glucose/arabinose dehydrogenase
LRGKLLRVYDDGTSPSDNPYRNQPGARRCGRPSGPPPGTGPCKEIYAHGFRNPFRFSTRQANSSLIVGDVGEGTWEELDTLLIGRN